ncbi:MAG: LicD family protein [Tannerellaceae bacterium]|jgi:lipopolysaccharide cholinephosphotransferase|nr:LicD family protein [Tannerellaceae bacterium]
MGLSSRNFFLEAALCTNILKELSQDEKRQLQLILLHMLKDVVNICNRNKFCYMLVYGSSLGAVRHKGFIPWDDDLDIGILRKDYIPFLKEFKKEFGDKYNVGYPNGISHGGDVFAKIKLKGTRCIEIYNLSAPFYNGIYLDIFPIENMPNNILKHGFYGLFFDIVLYITNSVRFYEYSNVKFKQYMSYSKRSRIFYQMRMVLGFLFSFFSYKKWCYLYDKWVSSLPESSYLGIPTSRRHFLGGRLRKEFFLPTTVGIFEGERVHLPGNCHEYLRNTYGDYMKIPDVSERERHFVVEFDPGEFKFNEPCVEQKSDSIQEVI